MAKAENTRPDLPRHRARPVQLCARHDLPPLPGSCQDVAAFLAGERDRKLAPETHKLRRAIRSLHRAGSYWV